MRTRLLPNLKRRFHLLVVTGLLVGAMVVRVDGITRPSLESRELHNALIARQYYLGDGAGLPPWKQNVLREVGEVVRPLEPPILDLLAAAAFRLTGGEDLWVPRLVSALMWLVGGVFLYLIAARLTTRAGAMVTLALYLFWPYGAFISRLYMPDAAMLALMLGASLAVLRYWEAPSFARLGAAGAASAVATVVKPGIAILFLVPLFVALAASKRVLVDVLARGRLAFFVMLALLPSVVYYVYGTYVRDFLSGESEGRVEPGLIATAWFWKGWWEMCSIVLAFPQRQGSLALLPIAAALVGALVARGTVRAVLVGLGLGYIAFAVTFTAHVPSHPYYSLPLIPILALAIGILAGAVLDRLGGRARIAQTALVGFVAFVVGVAAFKSHAVLAYASPEGERQIADYRRIGELTGHTTRAIVIDVRLMSPISYWGWMIGHYWYPPTPAEDLGEPGDRFPLGIDPAEFDFLIVVEMSELESEPELRAFTRDLPVVERTSRYAVFDLRSGRAVTAARRPRGEAPSTVLGDEGVMTPSALRKPGSRARRPRPRAGRRTSRPSSSTPSMRR
jgi:4-amino-4-deoxy-L-arabinose transferase-like glycosyltransferase